MIIRYRLGLLMRYWYDTRSALRVLFCRTCSASAILLLLCVTQDTMRCDAMRYGTVSGGVIQLR